MVLILVSDNNPGCGTLKHLFIFFFTVFHYQLKINFLGKINQLAMEPALTVSLYGTNGEAEDLKLNMWVIKKNIQWGKNIWSPADFVHLPTDKEIISL